MRLRSLRLRGWRNFDDALFEPGPRVSVLHGDNGQGKTNVLEATHFLFELRSWRSRSLSELVQWGRDRAILEAEVEVGGLVRKLGVEVSAGRRTFSIDGKPARRDVASLAAAGIVLFVPEDLLLARASPQARRTFIDRAAFGIQRRYYNEATVFQRLLKSRNALLKDAQGGALLIETYDEQLSIAAARIVLRRRAIAACLAPRLTDVFRRIHGDLNAAFSYVSHPEIAEAASEENIAEAMRNGLRKSIERDRQRGYTSFGPHTDDIMFRLCGEPAAEHASQGQLRSFVLALKLAELENLADALGESPLLLLDDVASELDETRRKCLFEALATLPGQAILTLTDPALLPRLPGRRDVGISAGDFTS